MAQRTLARYLTELHRLYQQVDQLSDEDQQALIILLDSLVKRSKVRSVMADETPPRGRSPGAAVRRPRA